MDADHLTHVPWIAPLLSDAIALIQRGILLQGRAVRLCKMCSISGSDSAEDSPEVRAADILWESPEIK